MSRVLVFDLDDTLYLEREFARSGFRAAGAWLARERGIIGFGEAAMYLFDSGVRGTVFDRVLTTCGLGDDAELIAALVSVYRDHAPNIAPLPDATWALDRFGRDRPLALLTDGPGATQRKKVEALGIASRFAALVYSDDGGRAHWKPSPVPFQRIMDLFGPAEREFTYVADNPMKDFVTPRALGWDTVHVIRDGGEYARVAAPPTHQARAQIPTLYELAAVLTP